MTKIHNATCLRFFNESNFRQDVYRIIDDESFIKIKGWREMKKKLID